MVQPWCECMGDVDPLVTPHEVYLNIAPTTEQRRFWYRELFKEKLSDKDVRAIRKATHYCQPLGGDKFRDQTEKKLGRKLGHTKRGRPKKSVGQN